MKPAAIIETAMRGLSLGLRRLRRARHRWGVATWLAVAILAGWLVIIVVAPLVTRYDPLSPAAAPLMPPTPAHPMGTDEVGRDVLSRLLWGARVSLINSFIIVIGASLVGSVLGGVAGYLGGWAEAVAMRLADLVFAFPAIILAMAISAALGAGLANAVIAVIIVAWPPYARVARSLVLTAKRSDYVSSARLLGASSAGALAVDVAPNIVGPIVVLATLDFGQALLFLASLSFLGLGAQPPTPEWGSMISEGFNYINQWWLSLYPGLAIVSVVMAFTILGDTLRDRLDARLSLQRA